MQEAREVACVAAVACGWGAPHRLLHAVEAAVVRPAQVGVGRTDRDQILGVGLGLGLGLGSGLGLGLESGLGLGSGLGSGSKAGPRLLGEGVGRLQLPPPPLGVGRLQLPQPPG